MLREFFSRDFGELSELTLVTRTAYAWEGCGSLPGFVLCCSQEISSFGHLHARSGQFGQDPKESWLQRAEEAHEKFT